MIYFDDGLDGELVDEPASLDEAGALEVVMSDIAPGVPQPQRDQQKLQFLAKYATEDCGCKTPADVLALYAKLDTFGGYGAPHTLVDRLYAAANQAKAYASFQESKLK